MGYTAHPWFSKSAVTRLSDLRKSYDYLASPAVIEQAAEAAGATLVKSMQSMVRSQSDLAGFQDVSEGFTTWKDDNNVLHVGLPPGHQLLERAKQMEQQFPLKQVVMEMEYQTGDTQRAFLGALAQRARLTK